MRNLSANVAEGIYFINYFIYVSCKSQNGSNEIRTPYRTCIVYGLQDSSGIVPSAREAPIVKNIGKPDAGKLHVRFEEGGLGTTL
jgi:hypothetical protein